jgi:SAM-dependent methyltransferase
MLKHLFKPVTVEEERDFERTNVGAKLQRYLQTNPLDRYEKDAAYHRKINYVGDALGKINGFVLDIGGNTAGEATILQQQGYHFVVGDINEIALDISRQRVEKFQLKKLHYVALDAHHLPFDDASFSAATIIEALHHLPSYPQALREILRVLKPGGRLVSLEPNALNPLRRLTELRDRFRGTIELSFHLKQLKSLCLDAGFEQADVRAVPTGRSDWKLAELPPYHRAFTRWHGTLSEKYPRMFGNLLLVARKSGSLVDKPVVPGDFEKIIRSPASNAPVAYDPRSGLWAETPGKLGFPDFHDIPRLIAADAVPLTETPSPSPGTR